MRLGGNNNGAYLFNRYDAENETWSKFTKFNLHNQKSEGNAYNWGLYGNMKYLNGKLRVGFQQRSSDNEDKYKYQNGVYYAYSDHPQGFGEWFNHKGEPMTWPLINSDEIKVFEPGDYISHEQTNSVYIVKDFDWTVTARGDIHIISLVQTNNSSSEAAKYGFDNVPKEKVYIHSYKPAGADEFIIDTDFVGATSIYTSGDNIYVIGLKNGRPFIEMAQGGTNVFSRVYEATSGPTFAHGTIYIRDGKVYYYLQERGSGTELPLYLQIIDLDIAKISVSFNQSEVTLLDGYTAVTITASAAHQDDSRVIQKVELYLDDELVSTKDTAPYTWTQSETKLQNLAVGTYSIKAIVTDDANATAESYMTLNVVETAPSVAFMQPEITLMIGYDSVDVTVNADTPDDNRTIAGVSLYIDEALVATLTTAPYKWTYADAKLQNLDLGTYTLKAVVEDSAGEKSEAIGTLTVIDPRPVAKFSKDSYIVTEGYTSLSLNVEATTPVAGRAISQVELFVNDDFIRKESVAPYDWGHSDSFAEELLNFPVGTHRLKAVVTDNEGVEVQVFSDLIVQEVEVAPTVRFEQNSISLVEGYTELTVSVTAISPMGSRNIQQVTLFINDIEVSTVTAAPYKWSQTDTALNALAVGNHTLKAIATDSGGLSAETTLQIQVTALTNNGGNAGGDNGTSDDTSSGGTNTFLAMIALTLLALRRRVG